ncbi:hypothetical protein M433DRAFT_330714 [Acidomyces richmondensis BFW]|nr:hypothetical protein M433DRAFT_330714 [Acidomyces richmondensis BFW]
MYLSVEALEGRDGCHNFYGLNSGSYAPIIAGTIMPLGPDEQSSGIMTFPGITNDAQSTSVASIIANLESDKWSDLFGVGWQTSYQLALPITTALVPLNPADLGRPPPLLSYYFGPAGVACLMNYQAGPLPGGLPCNTIFDGEYVPQVQVGKAANAMNPMWSTCYRDFGWDPPGALSPASSVIGPSTPHPQSATTTSPAHNDHHSSSAQTSLGPSTTDPASPSSSPHVSTAAPTSRGGGDPTSSPNQPPNSASQHIQSTRISSSSTDPSSGGGSPDSSQTSSSNNPGGLIVSIIAGSSTQKVSSDPSPGSAGQGSGSGPASAASGGDPGASTSVSGSSAAFLLGSSSLTAVQSGSVFVVSGGSSAIATLTAGGAGTTIGTQVISAGSSALQVGSSTITFSTDGGSGSGSGSQTTINVAGQSIAIGLGPGKSGVAVIDGSVTLSNGESGTVVNGQSVSLGSQGLAIGSTTVLIGQDDPSDSVTTATIDGISYTMSAVISGSSTLEAVDGSITLTPGGAGTTLSNGKILSVPIAGGVVIGSSTIQVGPLTSSGQFDAIVNAGGQKFTAVQSGSYILLADGDSTITISDGQVTTFNGQIVSALSNGIGVAIDGSTTARFSAQPTADAIITAGGHTFTAYPSGDFILLVDGSSTATLRDGQTTILEGQTVKALLDGDGIVVGATKTDIFSNFSTSTSSRLAPSSGRLTSVSAAGTAASPFSTKSGAAMKKSAMREMLLAFSMAMAVVLI